MITSLPLILFNFLELKTKTILRISGSPKLNFLRKNYGCFPKKNYMWLLALRMTLKNHL